MQLLVSIAACLPLASSATAGAPDVRLFLEAASTDEQVARAALEQLGRSWSDDYAALVVDLLRFTRPPDRASAGVDADLLLLAEDLGPPLRAAEPAASGAPDPTLAVRRRLVSLLERKTGQRFGHDLRRWRLWLWNRPYRPHPDYAFFKAALYSAVDRRMAAFFASDTRASIRLDEIDWGGVTVDGIPPLDHPQVVAASGASWLKDGHRVFGVVVNGEARAYPQRILGWHELARDRLGGVELTIVYCTLCGTVVPYASSAGGRQHVLGTSGLLYRSNKLMYDRETMSLWSTAEGRPVVGPLAGSGLELTPYPVVTTTWGEWRALHPETTVVSLQTGHQRDYSEGAAYRDYFGTHRLMFGVPRTDDRLRNKDEVLALLLAPRGEAGADRRALALSDEFLRANRLHSRTFAGHALVVLTSPRGANRVYSAEGVTFVRQLSDAKLVDSAGRTWTVTEDALKSDDGTESRARVPARRAFWFGWHAQFPETELVK